MPNDFYELVLSENKPHLGAVALSLIKGWTDRQFNTAQCYAYLRALLREHPHLNRYFIPQNIIRAGLWVTQDLIAHFTAFGDFKIGKVGADGASEILEINELPAEMRNFKEKLNGRHVIDLPKNGQFIQRLDHASLIIQTHHCRVLVDPVPLSSSDLANVEGDELKLVNDKLDLILITHSHGDHFHIPSLMYYDLVGRPEIVIPVEKTNGILTGWQMRELFRKFKFAPH